ncbi:hypothetical protein ACTJI8_12700 [Microbacterium sp. 22303]|uniref:hypothetical protein n=1 Tax=Microbacterium sp. 22303 TaxID=3453905 RepID=UPI003F8636FD
MQSGIQDDGLGAEVCPICGVVLRDEGGALACPEHGVIVPRPTGVVMPAEFDGPDFHDVSGAA